MKKTFVILSVILILLGGIPVQADDCLTASYITPMMEYALSDSTVTLYNLYGIKDIFIASGMQYTYRDVKNTLIYSLTSSKLGESTEYSYTFRGAGMHTVYIRFNDGRDDTRIMLNIHVTRPSFKPGNGTLTVSNIEDAKVLRIAKGVYDSVAEMKASGNIVNYTGRILKEGKYTLRFKVNYEYYTVAVEYNTGYVEIYKYVVYGVL